MEAVFGNAIIIIHMNRDSLIQSLQEVLAALRGVSLAYLFGSQVGGATGVMSDVDLGIVLEGVENCLEVQSLLSHQLGKAVQPLPVDVILLKNAPIELAYAVIAQGICIYQRDTLTRVEFEAEVMSRYGDYLPVLRAQKRAILEEVGNDRRVQRYREALRRTERTLEQVRAAQK